MWLNSPATNPELTHPATNLTGFLTLVDHQMKNVTSQDLLYDHDINILDEIKLMSLATQEGFIPMEVSCFFEELDSDSGFFLNPSHSGTSVPKSNSSICEEDAIGFKK